MFENPQNQPRSPAYQATIAAIILAIVIIGFFVAKSTVRGIKQGYYDNQDGQSYTNNSDGQSVDLNTLAREYRAAANNSGTDWMIDFDGTDVEAMYSLAEQSKGIFTQVAKRYKQLYNEVLLERIAEELNSSEFAKFKALAGL
ncbi:hypothetical protein SAMN05421780_1247 [Flexibacter flexilis DSM 6793]|uniref:Annexin n=1 Tax=Flexibacter flexilis DSM 6793 TaxID=927664 RepID=A0A1I1NXZ1_9BACT|nr:hypothetical protein [Flexibacter flexilis]SFD02561.1 hypothetical protein SAMN05421780_1247 [Flexibacter flexilis DSM 6793]